MCIVTSVVGVLTPLSYYAAMELLPPKSLYTVVFVLAVAVSAATCHTSSVYTCGATCGKGIFVP